MLFEGKPTIGFELEGEFAEKMEAIFRKGDPR